MPARNICIPFAVLCFCRPAAAQRPYTHYEREMAKAKAFVPVYHRYIEAIKTLGIAGLQSLTAPHFILKWDNEAKTGEQADAELKRYLSDPPKNDLHEPFAVTLRRLTFVGDRVILDTEETGAFHFTGNDDNSITLTWFWIQTWRNTPRG